MVVWRSMDGGVLWQRMERSPAGEITALAMSPNFGENRTLCASTSAGMIVSRDGGDSFRRWDQAEIEPVSVIALNIVPGTGQLYALGLDGRIWRRHLSL
jgi:hypothetical protein